MKKEATLYEVFSIAAKEHKKNKALVYLFKTFNYKYVLDKVNRLAKGLKSIGIKENDVVTIMLPNIPMAVFLLYATNQIGAIANLIHPLMKNKELKEIMIKTNSKILFLLDSNVESFLDFIPLGIKLYSTSPVNEINFIKRFIYNRNIKKFNNVSLTSNLLNYGSTNEFDKDYLKDSFYLHSGGTTGEPKTIALSSFSLNAITTSGLTILDLKDPVNVGMFATLPMFHGFGLCMGIHASLSNGAFNVLVPKFNTKDTIRYLKRNELQTIIGVPILYEALLRNKKFKGKKLKKLYNAFVGGDFTSLDLKKRFNTRMIESGSKARLFEGYGLTETVTVCAVNTHPFNKEGSVGKNIPFTKIRSFKGEKELDFNVDGELCISGETLMNGYRFEKKTTNPFFIDKNNVKWVRSGDYGYVDKEEFVYFKQRLKRIAKINGITIFPSAIENELMNLPFIFECHIKSIDDNKHGNILMLYIVLEKNSKNKNYDQEINEFIISKFSIYAKPKKIIYLDKLPKTLIGKVNEQELKE